MRMNIKEEIYDGAASVCNSLVISIYDAVVDVTDFSNRHNVWFSMRNISVNNTAIVQKIGDRLMDYGY